MIRIFENFFTDLFKDAFPFVDAMFSMILKIVFNIENNLFDGSIFENTISQGEQASLGFNSLFNVTLIFGISLCTFKFLKKIFDTYILGTDGDSSSSAERMLFGFIKALIIIFSFNYFYEIFVDITEEFLNDILNGIGESTRPSKLVGILDVFVGQGLFKILGLLVFFIGYLMLMFQFIKRGLEMLILRLGIPLAVSGLIDSDNGVFAPYIKLFIQNSLTVVIQIALLKLGLNVMANGNMFFGIATMFMAIKTPQFLQQFMIGVGGSNINVNTIGSVIRTYKSMRR